MLMTVNRNGVELPAFHDGIEPRILGRIKTDNPKMSVPPFTDYLQSINAAPVIDLSKIPDYDRYQSNVPILDQDGIGACCGHSHTIMMMKARDQAGYQFEELCADSLYAQVNGGHDGGSDPADCITAMQKNGICLLSEVPNKWVLWSNIPASAKENALRFRILGAAVYECANFVECVTADWLGFSVTFTINVGPNFGPGSDGVVGFWPGFSNHCVAMGEALRTVNGERQARFRNSWSKQWGDNGCAWIRDKSIDGQSGGEHYALMWALVDPKDPTNVPVVLS